MRGKPIVVAFASLVAVLFALQVVSACSSFSADSASDAGDGADSAAAEAGDGGTPPSSDSGSVDAALEASCAVGPCGAVTLAKDLPPLARIAVAPTAVYAAQVDGTIDVVSLAGPGKPTVFAAADAGATALAVVGSDLVVTSNANGTVQLLMDKTASVLSSQQASSPTEVAVDSHGIVVLQSGGSFISAVQFDPALATSSLALLVGDSPTALALDPLNVYVAFNGDGSVVRGPRDAQTAMVTANLGVHDIVAMDADTTTLYFAASEQLRGLPLGFAATTAPSLVHAFATGVTITAIVARADATFVATRSVEGTAIIHHLLAPAAGAGRAVEPVATVADCDPRDIDVDAAAVYWLCVNGANRGAIWKARRPGH